MLQDFFFCRDFVTVTIMYKKTILKNGLRLMTYSMPESEAITAQVFFNTGSYFEDKSINGISHFLEHLFFKGSKKFPNPGQMHEETDKVGGVHNAYTDTEVTSYYIKVANKYTDLALELLSDALLRPLFPREEIEKERNVILEEIRMRDYDDPDGRVAIKFEELLYGDQPAGRPIGGREEVIKKLQQEDFFNYKSDHYHIDNAVVVVAGKIREKEIQEKVETFFAPPTDGLPKKAAKGREKVRRPTPGPKIVIERRPSEQTKIIFGVPAYSLFDPRRYAIGMLANILGGTASSRLFKKIREERGLAYSVYSYNSQGTDTGSFISFAGTEMKNTELVLKLIREEYQDIAERGVAEKELQMAKDNIIGRLGIGLETSDRWAGFLGTQELLERKIEMPNDIAREIKHVTAQDVKEVAGDIFKSASFHLALLGPFPEGAQERYQALLA